jgi:hypothetical protein
MIHRRTDHAKGETHICRFLEQENPLIGSRRGDLLSHIEEMRSLRDLIEQE